jgi:hypothetical protein
MNKTKENDDQSHRIYFDHNNKLHNNSMQNLEEVKHGRT